MRSRSVGVARHILQQMRHHSVSTWCSDSVFSAHLIFLLNSCSASILHMCTVGIAAFFTKWGCISKPRFISCCPGLGLHSGLLPASRLFLCCVFLSLAWHCQKMIYLSGFVPQTTSIESQIHRDLTGLLSFALTFILPSNKWAWGGGCLPVGAGICAISHFSCLSRASHGTVPTMDSFYRL